MNGLIHKSRARLPLLGAVVAVCILCGGCRSKMDGAAAVTITRVPDASPGGPEKLDYIEGTVRNAKQGQHIVLYAHSGLWWVQPFANQTTTNILPDGSWKNSTHLGTEYAALLVDAAYVAPARIETLPPVGSGVLAVVTAAGKRFLPSRKRLSTLVGTIGRSDQLGAIEEAKQTRMTLRMLGRITTDFFICAR